MKILELRNQLRDRGLRLVLAESCTSGLVAAELGRVPGISDYFCGSMVVYRNATKSKWLGIAPDVLENPKIGPVSHEVTLALAQSALQHTPEATLAGAITGHLGPGSPAHLDGVIFMAIVFADRPDSICSQRFQLQSPSPRDADEHSARHRRQVEAAEQMLDYLIHCLAPSQ